MKLKIGSHVGMSGKDMLLGSAKEAYSYGANVFMAYTGAPQNTRRKEISELKIKEAWEYMAHHNIDEIVIHAPYIINLANTIKPETYEIAEKFLATELERTEAMGSRIMVLHPGSHVGAGVDAGINQIVKGINNVLTKDSKVCIALETMAGKGSEIGRNFEELARIYDGVVYNDKLRVCFDTCHVNDAGYDLVNDLSGVFEKFDKVIGTDRIGVFHINDSKNVLGAGKDRHENIGFGNIVSAQRIVAIVSPESAPIKRMVQEAKDNKTAVDATCGRRTRAVIITDSGHIILSAVQPETVAGRFGKDATTVASPISDEE